jgi:hypothetical protein
MSDSLLLEEVTSPRKRELRRSTIIVLDKNDQFLLLGYIYIGNSRYFKNTNFLLILLITFEKLDFNLMSLGTTLGTLKIFN